MARTAFQQASWNLHIFSRQGFHKGTKGRYTGNTVWTKKGPNSDTDYLEYELKRARMG
jgi:hypothetical protein